MKRVVLKYKTAMVIRLLIFAATATAFGWSTTNLKIYLTIAIGFLAVLQIIPLVKMIDGIYERINFFFESVVNEDFSTIQHNRAKDEVLTRLNKNMDRVNKKIRQSIVDSQHQESYFRALIEHINLGVLTFAESGFVAHTNSALRKLLHVEHISHIKQLQKYNSQMFEIVENMQSEILQQVVSLTLNGEKKHLLLKSTPFCSNKEPLTIISFQDIDQQLDEKELDSWIKLIRVLTHEIMNGIAPITSLSESVLNIYSQDGAEINPANLDESKIKTTIKGLEVISEQSHRLTRFVESYRKITRLPKPEKKEFRLKPFLEKSLLLSKAGSYSSDVEIAMKFQEEGIVVNADEKQLTQVVLNIMKNSFEALESIPFPKVEVEFMKNKTGAVEIAIQNNGPQIPNEIIDDIFIPFFTTKEDGSGIGLSLSKQIVRLHGGMLKVNSNEELTRFVIVL